MARRITKKQARKKVLPMPDQVKSSVDKGMQVERKVQDGEKIVPHGILKLSRRYGNAVKKQGKEVLKEQDKQEKHVHFEYVVAV